MSASAQAEGAATIPTPNAATVARAARSPTRERREAAMGRVRARIVLLLTRYWLEVAISVLLLVSALPLP
jgi:hypothetical protein